jgi:hypothetical protein
MLMRRRNSGVTDEQERESIFGVHRVVGQKVQILEQIGPQAVRSRRPTCDTTAARAERAKRGELRACSHWIANIASRDTANVSAIAFLTACPALAVAGAWLTTHPLRARE